MIMNSSSPENLRSVWNTKCYNEALGAAGFQESTLGYHETDGCSGYSDPESPMSSFSATGHNQVNHVLSANAGIWKQPQASLQWSGASTATTTNSSSWQSWGEQRDNSQHSRASASIWAAGDDYSRSSHHSHGQSSATLTSSGLTRSSASSHQTLSVSERGPRKQDHFTRLDENLAELKISKARSKNEIETGSSLEFALCLPEGSRSLLGQLQSSRSSLYTENESFSGMLSPSPNFPSQQRFPLNSSASVASSIPELGAASSGSISAAGLSIGSMSRLNPNMGSWRPTSAPVGSTHKISLATTLAASRIGTSSPLSSLISPPPLFHPEQQRKSSSMNSGSHCQDTITRRSSTGSSGKGRDRPKTNRKKQTHQASVNMHQPHSPQALKEVNNYKSEISDSTFFTSPRSLISPQRRSGTIYDLPSPSMASSPVTGVSSEAIRALMKPKSSFGTPSQLNYGLSDPLDQSIASYMSVSCRDITDRTADHGPILPQPSVSLEDLYPSYFGEDISEAVSDDDYVDADDTFQLDDDDLELDDDSESFDENAGCSPYGKGLGTNGTASSRSKKRDWLLRMNRKLNEIAVGELDPSVMPLSAVMNAWAKTKSAQGASMVEMWLKRAQEEYNAGNLSVVPTTKMYTMAVDAWARSGEGGAAAQRAEALLQHMHQLYQSGGHEDLRPTNAIFNAVINAWARSREKIAPVRAEQILNWMQNLSADLDIQPDKYTFNTVIHAWAKAGGTEAASKAQELLARMHSMYQSGNLLAKPDTISYNVVINAWAKSGGQGAASEAEKLLLRMNRLHEMGDPDVKPNVVTYGAVIDSFAKSGERGAAARADTLLAKMIQLHQSDPVKHADLLPNTYVFNTVINCWAKSKENDAASKAEEMLVAMSRLHASGMPSLKPDNFTYTAVIDAWAKSGYKGAASRADQLLDKMEAKYLAGDSDLKPNSYTYNAVICALAKSGEPGAAARAERVLQNMVNRHRSGGDDDIKPTTINFNTVLDAWAKSRGGRAAAERAEEILEWMDRLHKGGNQDVKVDTISFNAVLDAWARSGDRVAPRRAEQILSHMDELFRNGNSGVKPDRYTYNTLINVWAKSGERGSAARAEEVLSAMEKRHRDGDQDFKPNTRTYTSVIDAWAKSGEAGAARRAEQILNNMISRYEAAGDPDVRPNVHTANAVCNACAFSKNVEDREEALQIAFRVFDWLANQSDMSPDSYTYTILLSVCSNLLSREDSAARYIHARAFFESCRDAGYVNDYVLRKLRQTVSEDEFLVLIDYRTDSSAANMPSQWTRNAKLEHPNTFASKGKKNLNWWNKRKGK